MALVGALLVLLVTSTLLPVTTLAVHSSPPSRLSGAGDDLTFSIIFSEGGLFGGTSWSVVLNGTEQSSTGTTIEFSGQPSGNLSFSVPTVTGYSANPSSGTISVQGNTTQGVTFTPVSPHPGTIEAYEVTATGSNSEDPSVDYESYGGEVIANVYQTLITYNGSSANTFTPEVATCVPGTVQCVEDYGSDLIVNGTGQFAGQPEYWTFVIDPEARFYDPSTGASWGVYPSDVMFSLARTCAFINLPGVEIQPGWIQCQALLPSGNNSWDLQNLSNPTSGLHYPYNNTPTQILGSMLVNDTAYCPTIALTNAHGCITFRADGGGLTWPFFLKLMAENLGASIEPCGWFTYESAGVPDWAGPVPANGDGSCPLPDGGTTTNSINWTSYLNTLAPGTTGFSEWDSFEELANHEPSVQPNVQWKMVGSGPYSATIDPHVSYELKASPAYTQPSGCSGQGGLAVYPAGCSPAPGKYIGNVSVTWEANDSQGVTQLAAGQADYAQFNPVNTSKLLDLSAEGRISLTTVPTANTYINGLDFLFNNTTYRSDGLPDPSNITVPEDFFTGLAVRQFLVQAYPYDTIESAYLTIDGIPYFTEEGGPIPPALSPYYPSSIPYPSGNPTTNASVVGGAAWWWAQGTNASSPYYDPELAHCTTVTPCKFPLFTDNSGVQNYSAFVLWTTSIASLSGGALEPVAENLSFPLILIDGAFAPFGQNALPEYTSGWLPDYMDPTDYMTPFISSYGTFSGGDRVWQQLNNQSEPVDNATLCGYSVSNLTDLNYWANVPEIAEACQGVAYDVAIGFLANASSDNDLSSRINLYTLIESITNKLALYVWAGAQNLEVATAAWIDPSSINTNPMIGGSGEVLWYDLRTLAVSSAPQTVSVGAGPDAVVYDSFNGNLYTANFYSGTVSVVNASTNALVATVPVGTGPDALAVVPRNGNVFVANVLSDNVTVINGTTNEINATIAVGTSPLAVAYDPSNGYVYVANSGSGNVSVIDGNTSAVVAPGVTAATEPEALAVDSLNGYVFVLDYSAHNVTVINGTLVKVQLGLSRDAGNLAWDPDNWEMYVAVTSANAVVVVSGSLFTIVTQITVTAPEDIVWNPVNHDIYVVDNGEDTITRINTTSNTVAAVIPDDPQTLQVDPVNGNVFAVDFDSDSVTVLSPTTNAAVATYTTGSGPTAAAVDPVTGTLFVADETSGEVSVIPTFTSVSFDETGLAAGITWSIIFNGGNGASVSLSLSFSETNGTYSYTVSSVAGYFAIPSSGTVVASGSTVTVQVTFIASGSPLGVLLGLYNSRPDLEAQFPGVLLGNSTSLVGLVSWAADVVTDVFPDAANETLAAPGVSYYYVLMGLYNSRADLQAAFPNAYTNPTSYIDLLSWAGYVVGGQIADPANPTLGTWGYAYALLGLYVERADLQSAFPGAASSSPSEFLPLVSWAGAVVNQTITDADRSTILPYGYFYALMWVYNGRADLQAEFPDAYGNVSSYGLLLHWAYQVASGELPDPAYSTLSPYVANYEPYA